ncbi:MAG: SDR family NAD(P)-dependent oxidoreductase [Acidimicrobiales bacterium]
MTAALRDLVVVADPCGQPNPALVAAAARAGALGVLDLLPPSSTRGASHADDLGQVIRRTDKPFAVRVPYHAVAAGADGTSPSTDPAFLPHQVDTIILTGHLPAAPPVARRGPGGRRRIMCEVTSRDEATRAIALGASGLVAKGCESGGRIGDVEAFVLAQQVAELGHPFWVLGGIGEHTAAAAIAAGAAGVVLDGQVALLRESLLDEDGRAAVAAMDGSETRVVGGHRIYVRPDLPAAGVPASMSSADVAHRLGSDFARDLVPLGQDAAHAATFARRHVTVGRAVQAVRAGIESSLTSAAEHQPLQPGAGVSSTNGTRYPVVQGPMTRVSDRAEMALAVAEAGGLPFLALALLSGPDVRQLLTETAALLGDRPWGVGVLGFVPADVRAAQLDVIHEIRPPVALIAGGRPSQAQPLEAAGITTYLHVPSPGLLDRFLREGARRFVFEGRECGGHVGPRASLPLWEAQIERLLDHDALDDLDVLFAGGIHDARSAAMVAAIAAPLTARGARIGVLMGTAYLFTDEAVSTGAITPMFQEVAQACDTTVLLETAPGHATRCVETAYVRAFSARKAQLEAAGVPAQDMWAELEALNLGRLRVASKGVARDGAELVELDQQAQRRDGMFMIGQVATLRRERTTIAQLHRDVSAGATEHLAACAAGRTRPVEVREPARPVDVAIVGMAAVFPGAPDTDQFWANVVNGVDSVTEVPADRWDAEAFYDPEATTRPNGRTPSKWGGFVPAVPFDALAYGIPPRSLASIESVQLLSLEVAGRALADAGYDRRPFDRARASVIFGAENGNDLGGAYGFRAAFGHYVGALPAELDAHLPTPTEDSFPGVLTNVIAGRIANRLDLGGVNYTVDAACAASLAALDAACKELVGGTSDLVLCGAADVHNGINDYLLFASVHALSPRGRCRTFDASADGIALGEGVACVVLKRLEDAERDGDRVYAVVSGIAGSSDGRHLGLTAPRPEGQERALVRAYGQAGFSPASVGLVEAHGTGTVVGDRAELATLTGVFSAADAVADRTVLGSVKSQIGHTKCAAGLAGLIKVAHALHAGVLPPTLHIEEPNAYYRAGDSPFRFLDRPAPWPTADRQAGVSAFGFGGTNFHAVLRAHRDDDRPSHGMAVWPVELFLVRAPSDHDARERLGELRTTLERIVGVDPGGERHRLRDLAFTVSTSGAGEVHYALVAGSLAELAAQAAAVLTGGSAPGLHRATSRHCGPGAQAGRLAFLHPGQGSQRPGMLADLLVAFPRLQSVLSDADPHLVATMFPGAAFSTEQRAAHIDALTDTRAAQPALGLIGLATTRLLRSLGIEPDMAAGHSYGELVALATAGAIDDATLLDLSHARAAAMVDAAATLGRDAGAMAAVALAAGDVRRRLPADVVVANHNGPRQTVVAGPTPAVDALVADLAAQKISAKRLNVAAAFHSPLVAQASGALAASMADRPVREPRHTVWSNATAAPYPREADAVRATLARQLGEPVRFVDQIEAMYADGARVFVEAGPGRTLTQLVDRILGDRPHLAVAIDAPGEHGIGRLLGSLADLACTGVPVDVRPLFADRAERLDLSSLPVAAPGWRLSGHLVCTHDGEPVTGGLQPADRIPEVMMDHGPARPPSPPADSSTAVLEYLRTMQRLADAQRDVMLSYLGDRAAAADLVDLPSPLPVPAPLSGATGIGTDARPASSPDGRHDRATPAHDLAPALASVAGSANGNGHDPGYGTQTTVEVAASDRSLDPIAAATRPATATADTSDLSDTSQPSTLHGAELLTAIVDVVAERTGYPREMLDPDLDLEADLSIDSIKRIEIIGELADRVGLPGTDPVGNAEGGGVDEAVVEELAQLKSLRAIVAWIDAQDDAGHGSPTRATTGPVVATAPGAAADGAPVGPIGTVGPADSGSPARPGTTGTTAGANRAPAHSPGRIAPDGTPPTDPRELVTRRFVLEAETLAPALPVASLAGQRAVVFADPWDGLDELCRRLTQAGATVEVVPTHRGAPRRPLPTDVAARVATVDVVVHLGAADPVDPVDARDVFAALRPAIDGRATTIVAAAATYVDTTSTAVSGVGGLMRSIARELADKHVRVVEVPPGQTPKVMARLLADEVLDPAGPASILYRNGVRTTRRVVKGLPLGQEVPALPLNQGSVVVVTGGARGITARAAIALATTTGCRLELLGRTPLPTDEDPHTAAATDRMALRRVLIEVGELRSPSDIEAACSRILAAREVRSTLDALHSVGAAVDYHPVDVRDPDALGLVLAGIRARHGRIDAVVHGAGVLDDRLARDKSDESFDRVFATKVTAARTLLDHLGTDTRLVVFFGSVSGVFGNRGQVDYSAANDALDELALRFDGSGGRRVVSIDWGPWAATGMVTPELEREYARRGVGLVEPAEGVRALMNEMATLPGEPAQVIVMRAEPYALEARPPTAPGTFARASVAGQPDDRDPEHPTDQPGLTLEDLTERG